MVRIARELGLKAASGDDARRILKIVTWYNSVEETLPHLGLPPVRPSGHRGFLTYETTGKRPDLEELDRRVPADLTAAVCPVAPDARTPRSKVLPSARGQHRARRQTTEAHKRGSAQCAEI
jgi:hypothetical protein